MINKMIIKNLIELILNNIRRKINIKVLMNYIIKNMLINFLF